MAFTAGFASAFFSGFAAACGSGLASVFASALASAFASGFASAFVSGFGSGFSAGASIGTLEWRASAGLSLTAGMEPVSSATDTPPSSMLRRLRRRGASVLCPCFAARAISSATVSFSSLIFANSFPGKCYSSPLSILVKITPSRSAQGQISTFSISKARIAASATKAPATI